MLWINAGIAERDGQITVLSQCFSSQERVNEKKTGIEWCFLWNHVL